MFFPTRLFAFCVGTLNECVLCTYIWGMDIIFIMTTAAKMKWNTKQSSQLN